MEIAHFVIAEAIENWCGFWRNSDEVVICRNNNTERIGDIAIYATVGRYVNYDKCSVAGSLDARKLIVIEHLHDEVAINFGSSNNAIDFFFIWSHEVYPAIWLNLSNFFGHFATQISFVAF